MDTVTSGGEDAAEATAALYASDAVSGGDPWRSWAMVIITYSTTIRDALSSLPPTPPHAAFLPRSVLSHLTLRRAQVLWGTVSEEIRASPASVQQYFDYYASLDSLSVVEGSYQPSIRVFGDVAISSGTYTFRYAEGGVERLVPQRFTFVYRRSADSAAGWEIVDHHSSQVRMCDARADACTVAVCGWRARLSYRPARRRAHLAQTTHANSPHRCRRNQTGSPRPWLPLGRYEAAGSCPTRT